MVSSAVTAGSLAFVGPPHVPALLEFHYIRVNRVDGTQVQASIVDPGGSNDNDDLDPIDVAVIKRRLVSDDEARLLPGSYVGHPVAYIQPDGTEMDTWSYAVVVGYHMHADAVLHLRYSDGSCKLALQQPSNVVKVEWLDYALQVEGGSSAAAINAAELPEKLEEVRTLCAKSRAGIPAKVANSLTVPFEPSAIVPVVRPDTIAVVPVPRRHILDCALKRKNKRGTNMFVAPSQAAPTKSSKRKAGADASIEGKPQARRRRSTHTYSTESDDEATTTQAIYGDDDEDKREVQRQNRLLNDRELTTQFEPGHYAVEDLRSRAATTFRPTAIEKDIHDKIGHHDHQGKDPQCILEYEQQARGSDLLLGTPPVLRGAYDFGFRIRGLSVMHFAGVSRSALINGEVPSVNMTDFSRKNCIQPAKKDPTYVELKEALSNFRQFGTSFYNETTVDVLRAVERFVENFSKGSVPDSETTRRLVFWIDTKFCQFRGLVLSQGLSAAARVRDELSLHDPLLSELLYDEQGAAGGEN